MFRWGILQEAVQRLSFVSTSTGYSSARSSLRSSEISDDTVHPVNTSTGKKLLTFVSIYAIFKFIILVTTLF
ncbi:unnamed protein product [Onchocerca flexuosa]|uniref:Secreted protein n=1 Tax=Onchocerca flexuosa TaxID=387005 RepID=A0A183HLN9_9BILA|nr:unnamed protein product [Onchocerca flexuosa]